MLNIYVLFDEYMNYFYNIIVIIHPPKSDLRVTELFSQEIKLI